MYNLYERKGEKMKMTIQHNLKDVECLIAK